MVQRIFVLLISLLQCTITSVQCFTPVQCPNLIATLRSHSLQGHQTPSLHMSSVVVDDNHNSNNNNNDPSSPTPQATSQHLIATTATIDSIIPSDQQVQQLQSRRATPSIKKWMNSGLTVGTLLAIMACLLALDTTPGIWDSSHLQDVIVKIPNEIWYQYSSVLAQHPIATKACTSATVYTIGDIIAQRTTTTTTTTSSDDAALGVDKNLAKIDKVRVLRSMIAGLIGHGPLSHYWYNVCDHFFSDIIHVTAWWSFLPKVVVDQTIWGPIWNNTYLLLIGLMKFERLDVIWEDIQKSTIPMVVSGLKLWPAAHLITYGLIPNENRLLWVDMVEILWVTILSKQAASLDDDHHHQSSTVIDELSLQKGN